MSVLVGGNQRWLHLHLYRYVGSKGANAYSECRCGARKVSRGRGMSPIDRAWLSGDAKDLDRVIHVSPPPKPSDAGRSARP